MSKQKCLYVAVCGSPNAGKSTLVNALVGHKVSIISPKVQTTRTCIRGIFVQGDSQIVLIDTPGIFTPKRQLEKKIASNVHEGIVGVDLICFVVDGKKGVTKDVDKALLLLKQQGCKVILVLNKVDLMRRENILQVTSILNEKFAFFETFMISARKKDGTDDLRKFLVANAENNAWLFSDQQFCDVSFDFMVAEITREQLFFQLDKELPYSVFVQTEKVELLKGTKGRGEEIKIWQAIYVLNKGQKAIVLGKNGQKIKQIGEKARKNMEIVLGKKVHLFLHVIEKQGWIDLYSKGLLS